MMQTASKKPPPFDQPDNAMVVLRMGDYDDGGVRFKNSSSEQLSLTVSVVCKLRESGRKFSFQAVKTEKRSRVRC